MKVRQLDWLQYSLCTGNTHSHTLTHTLTHSLCASVSVLTPPPADADVDFSWTEEEVADLYDNTHFIIAADGRSQS